MRIKLLLAIGGFVLASCGGTSVATPASDSAARAGAELQEQFEVAPWQIVDREGFATTLPDGLATFEQFGVDDIITLQILPCGRGGGHPIEWNDDGFVLTDSANTEVVVGTEDSSCGPGDDLFDLFARGVGPDQFVAEISDDQTSATVRKGDLVLELVPASTTTPPETPAPSSAVVETTTTNTTAAPQAAGDAPFNLENGFGLECPNDLFDVFGNDELRAATEASNVEATLRLFEQSGLGVPPPLVDRRELIVESQAQLEFHYRRDDGSPRSYLSIRMGAETWSVSEYVACGT